MNLNHPADSLRALPLALIAADLLKQFNKPSLLGRYGLAYSKTQIDDLAAQISAASLPAELSALCEALAGLIAESEQELQTRFGLSFHQALATQDLSAIGGWETTADFLEIANHKSNAELRISAGATLLLLLGDVRHVAHLFTLLEVDGGLDDVDALLAKRALAHYSAVEMDSPDWLAQVRRALHQ
jgi:hypothetical protein